MSDLALPPRHAPRRRRLHSPTRRSGMAMVVAAALVALAVLRPSIAAPVAPSIRPDGLGTVTYGQDKASAVAALTEALGTPTNVGGELGPVSCVRNYQDIRWRDLTVSFADVGRGLEVNGWYWGNISLRNAPNWHLASRGPGSPLLTNPWGVRIGSSVPSVDSLVNTVRRTYPDARFVRMDGFYDAIINMKTNGRTMNIVLHPRLFGGYQVEAVWVFTVGHIPC